MTLVQLRNASFGVTCLRTRGLFLERSCAYVSGCPLGQLRIDLAVGIFAVIWEEVPIPWQQGSRLTAQLHVTTY
jgi:hypothetical protein